MATYYDYVLIGIPLTFVFVIALLTTMGLALSTAVAGGGVASTLLIGHAMFVRAPVHTDFTVTDGATVQTTPLHPATPSDRAAD